MDCVGCVWAIPDAWAQSPVVTCVCVRLFRSCHVGIVSFFKIFTAQKAAAAEILSRVREEVATRNAASMRGV